MQATAELRAEHDGVLTVLDQLERAAAAAEQGNPIPTDVFTDIQEFFTIFVNRCHHGKEESAVFPRLAQGASADLIHELDAEHDEGRALAAAYAESVHAYKPGDPTTGQRLAAAARAYDAFLREHIDEETRELFPLMESTLAADDAEMVTAFARIEEEQIGPGTHERLHGMIDGLPVRIGPFVR